eukprot:81580-Ditylum_brightwellii.AAC.1
MGKTGPPAGLHRGEYNWSKSDTRNKPDDTGNGYCSSRGSFHLWEDLQNTALTAQEMRKQT